MVFLQGVVKHPKTELAIQEKFNQECYKILFSPSGPGVSPGSTGLMASVASAVISGTDLI